MLGNENVRLAVGVADAAILLTVAFVFLDAGPVRWAAVAVAFVSAVTTPWVLGKAVETESEDDAADAAASASAGAGADADRDDRFA